MMVAHRLSVRGFAAVLLHMHAYVMARVSCEPLMLACYTAMLYVASLTDTNQLPGVLCLYFGMRSPSGDSEAIRRARYLPRLCDTRDPSFSEDPGL